MDGLNFAKFGKHLFQFGISGALRQALNKNVEEAALVALALLTALVRQHFDKLLPDFELHGLSEGLGGVPLILVLDVSKASALTIGEKFEFTRANRAEPGEGIVELLLSDVTVDVANEQVGLGLHEVALLETAADLLVSKFGVVELASGAFSLSNIKELEEAIAILALGLLVDSDDSVVNVVAL